MSINIQHTSRNGGTLVVVGTCSHSAPTLDVAVADAYDSVRTHLIVEYGGAWSKLKFTLKVTEITAKGSWEQHEYDNTPATIEVMFDLVATLY